MPNKNYQEADVVAQLKKNSDLNLLQNTKTIQQLRGDQAKGTVGNKTNGKIDFLTKYCGWTFNFVTSFKQ